MSDFTIANQGNSIIGNELYTRAAQQHSKHPSTDKTTSSAQDDNPEEKLSLSDDVEESEETGPEDQNPLLSALKGEQEKSEATPGSEGSEADGQAQPEEAGSDMSRLSSSAGEPVSDPFSGGEAGPALVRSTQVPDSFVSNTGVATPGDSSGNTIPSITVDLGDPEVAKAQVTHEITNQNLALDQSKEAQDQSGNAGSKIQGEIARHRGDQSNINELLKSKQADAGQGQAQMETERAQIEQQTDSIGQVQEAGNERASQVGQMQSALGTDQQAVDDAAESANTAREAEDTAQSTLDTAQQKLNTAPSATQSPQAAPAASSKTGKAETGGKSGESGKGTGNQEKQANEQQQRAEQQAQSQYQQAQQKLTTAQQQVQQAEQKQSKAEQKLEQDQATVDRAKQNLGEFSKTLDNGVKARRASEDQMAGDQKTLQDDQDGVRHLANRTREVSGFIDQNQDALVTTGKVEQISQNNVKGAEENIQHLSSLLPQLGAQQPGEAGASDDLAAQERAKERLKAAPRSENAQAGSSTGTANSAGIEAANAAGVTPAANVGSAKSTQRGDKLTIDLVTLKNAAAEVASDANAGGGRNQSYVGGVDDLGSADIAAPEGSGSTSTSPAINDSSSGESSTAHGSDGHTDHGNGKSASAPGHNKG